LMKTPAQNAVGPWYCERPGAATTKANSFGAVLAFQNVKQLDNSHDLSRRK
jgi:hypothetical protein